MFSWIKNKKNLKIKWRTISDSYQIILELSLNILNRFYSNFDELASDISNHLISSNFFNTIGVGIWLLSNESEGDLICRSLLGNNKYTLANPISFKDFKNTELAHWFLSSDSLSFYASESICLLGNSFYVVDNIQSHKYSSFIYIKILSSYSPIGILVLQSSSILSDKHSFSVNSVFHWLFEKDYLYQSDNLFKILGKLVGRSISSVEQAELHSYYFAELLDAKDTKDLRRRIAIQVSDIAKTKSFLYWQYDPEDDQLVLIFSTGVKVDAKHTVLNRKSCWFDRLFSDEIDFAYIKSSDKKIPKSYSKELIEDLQILAIPLRRESSEIFAVVTLHFKNNIILDRTLKDRLVRYFTRCAPLILSDRNRNENARRWEFEDSIHEMQLTHNIDSFYNNLVEMIKSSMGADDCSIFFRSETEPKLNLIASTSKLIPNNGINDIHYVYNDKSISMEVFKGNSKKIIYRYNEIENSYSSGIVSEFQPEKVISILFGRIKDENDNTIGIVRCLKHGHITTDMHSNIDIISYHTFDYYDKLLMRFASKFASILNKLNTLLYQEKCRAIDLEHETVTPISIVKHELDELKYVLRNLSKIDSSKLAQMIDPETYDQKNSIVWSRSTLNDLFNHWIYRIDIAKSEVERTITLIKMPNAADIPIRNYNIQPVRLSSLLTPLFHHADYLSAIKCIKVASFGNILSKCKTSRFICLVDKRLFQQSLLHIIDNAIKYSLINSNIRKLYGGEIWFELNRSISGEDKYISIRVCNYGENIPQSEINHIWKKNYRGSSARINRSAGNGIGLYVVKTVMDKMKCKVTLLSSEDNITKFDISVPLKEDRK